MGATSLSYALKLLTLTQEELDFIQACLLGDGMLVSSGRYYRFRVTHQLAHSEYVLWKHLQLKRLCASAPTLDRINQALHFGTVGHPEITNLKNLWYTPTKQIPEAFQLTEKALAIWFMDDGGRINSTVNFSVHSFSQDSIEILRKQLSQMQIETTIQSDGKGNRLYIKQASYPIFKNIVKPYIVECMAYKLP